VVAIEAVGIWRQDREAAVGNVAAVEVGRQWRGSLTVKAIQHHTVTTEV
jgi:hypothetical protein